MDNFDPAPIFALSLFPYRIVLRKLGANGWFNRLSRVGFQLTLLFVSVTIVAAIIARLRFNSELVAIDPLHGGAEAFLTLSNALIVAGLLRQEVPQR